MTGTDQAAPPLDALADAFEELLAAQRRLRGRDAKLVDGISLAQLRLLRTLARDGSMPATQLASAVAISPSSLTQALDGLERRGLVERVRSTDDRRVVTVALTQEGARRSEARRAELRRVLEQTFDDLPEHDLASGARILRRYASFLDAL
jgi:DNA-binding MarR family transcriptional regulator